ncbi:Nicolin-1 [Geodia barretti]|uniref:Nicolin-1 n=1 Tax=Geodia barretti TaxID=519541 RepID=A0AA35S6F9_GEOBA|nr:Nicolin-1 [Geodia barretti]
MDDYLIPCVVKPAVFLTVSGQRGRARQGPGSVPDSGNETRPSGCQVVDVEFRSSIPEVVGCISFQNYYTHTLTLRYCNLLSEQISNSKSDHPTQKEWRTGIERVQLMPNCHCERGSQSLVVLNKAHFLASLENVISFRLILRQPSPEWNQFGIRDLKIYSVANPFHRNGNTGTRTTFMSTDGMEQVLRNGLQTNGDMESGQDINRHPYDVATLSYT